MKIETVTSEDASEHSWMPLFRLFLLLAIIRAMVQSTKLVSVARVVDGIAENKLLLQLIKPSDIGSWQIAASALADYRDGYAVEEISGYPELAFRFFKRVFVQ